MGPPGAKPSPPRAAPRTGGTSVSGKGAPAPLTSLPSFLQAPVGTPKGRLPGEASVLWPEWGGGREAGPCSPTALVASPEPQPQARPSAPRHPFPHATTLGSSWYR